MDRVREREHLRLQRIPDLERAVLIGLEHIRTSAVRVEDHCVGRQVLTAHLVSGSRGVPCPRQRILLTYSLGLARHKFIRHNLQLQVEDRVAVMTRGIYQRVENNF